jgi:hypothetical protein
MALNSSKNGIVGSSPARGMDVCPYFMSCAVLCRCRSRDGKTLRPRCTTPNWFGAGHRAKSVKCTS